MRNLYLAFFLLFFGLEAFSQAANPAVQIDSCPYKIIFVLDESGSMGGAKLANLRAGSYKMVQGMIGSGTQMAVIEFASGANGAYIGGTTAYREVDATYASDFNYYVNCNAGGSSGYCPGGGTNWTAALNLVANYNINYPARADLIIFFTDGDPSGGGYIAAADVVKAQGSHMFLIAVLPGGPSVTRIQQISGTNAYTPGAGGTFLNYDYVLEAEFTTPECR